MRAPIRSLAAAIAVHSAATMTQAQLLEPDAQPLYSLSGFGSFGWAVSELADIDGDGVGEIIVGAPSFFLSRGEVYVYSGATGDEIFTVRGNADGRRFGHAVADAGDTNADGFSDIVVGGNGNNINGGTVVVLSGRPDSPGDELWSITAPVSTHLGYAVAGVGDVDGDGRSDVVVGQPNTSPFSGSGRAMILSGEDGSIIHELAGPNLSGDFWGRGVAGVGDIDGDGVGDAAVAAQGPGLARVFSGATGQQIGPDLLADPGNSNFGQFFVGRCGDVDADGTPDIYIGDFGHAAGAGRAYVFSGADGSRALTITNSTPTGLGPGRGLLADLDGDGHDDLAVGSYLDDSAAVNGGLIRVLSGRTGATLQTITGTVGGAQVGFDCVGAGDVNNDGIPDLIASAASGNAVHLVPGVAPCLADLTEPFGVLNFNDVIAFLNALAAMAPEADLADPIGTFDFNDVIEYLTLFAAGCP